jgi:hypothetical protein
MTDNPQVTFLKKIYSILTATEGSSGGAAANPIYIAFCNPGVPYPMSALNFDTTTKDGLANLAQWSDFVNTVPAAFAASTPGASPPPISVIYKPPSGGSTTGTWTSTGEKVNDVFEDFLQGAEAPGPPLTAAQQSEYGKALNYLQTTTQTTDPFTNQTKEVTGDSAAYAAYKTYQTAYRSALTAYNSARLTSLNSSNPNDKNMFAIQGGSLQDTITAAYNDWASNGNKGYVEEALGILASLSGNGFEQQRGQALSAFNSSALSDPIIGKFYPTPFIPVQFFTDPNSPSWTTYTYSHSEQNSYNDVSSSKFGGSTGSFFSALDAFGFSVGGSADLSADSKTVTSDDDEWSVTFDMVQLPLARGWFRYDLLDSGHWTWSASATDAGKYISLGHAPLASGESAIMPVYPTSIVMVRNILIKASLSKLKSTVDSYSEDAEVHVGWGPFNLGNAHQSSSGSTITNHVNIDTNGLSSPGISVIGFACQIIPDKRPASA